MNDSEKYYLRISCQKHISQQQKLNDVFYPKRSQKLSNDEAAQMLRACGILDQNNELKSEYKQIFEKKSVKKYT